MTTQPKTATQEWHPSYRLVPSRYPPVDLFDRVAAPAELDVIRRLRGANAWGVVYRSVRAPGGECGAVFRPNGVDLPVKQGVHVSLRRDGATISDGYKKSNLAHLTAVANR